MPNILQNYISNVIVQQKTNNNDVIQISTEFLSPEGDTFTLDTRALSPSVIQTTSSIAELQPEISTVYPFKIVTPVDVDGATILQSPNVLTPVTASQNYYTPIYFERYRREVLEVIDKRFIELTVEEIITEPTEATEEGLGDEFGVTE